MSSIRNKRVLLLLDHGNSLNADQLELTKSMGESMRFKRKEVFTKIFLFQPNKS